jgi:hypothetical protein
LLPFLTVSLSGRRRRLTLLELELAIGAADAGMELARAGRSRRSPEQEHDHAAERAVRLAGRFAKRHAVSTRSAKPSEEPSAPTIGPLRTRVTRSEFASRPTSDTSTSRAGKIKHRVASQRCRPVLAAVRLEGEDRARLSG